MCICFFFFNVKFNVPILGVYLSILVTSWRRNFEARGGMYSSRWLFLWLARSSGIWITWFCDALWHRIHNCMLQIAYVGWITYYTWAAWIYLNLLTIGNVSIVNVILSGFLNLNLPDCSGNQGIKDVMLAFEWVKENIHFFNGDSNNITAFGASSGAEMIHASMLSPTVNGK